MEEVTEKNILVNGIENQESDGNTSFLRAARNGQLEKVLEHLKTNIDINTSNANGLNALHLASKDGHVEIVEELLKRGAIVDAATKKGNTALHIASLAGQEEVVKLLVHHGASVNVQSQNGFTPLYMAAQENHDNVVKFLLANGANQSLSTEDGFTPLAVAMQQGHDKVVTVLLENDTRGKVRLPALHIAAKKDDVRAAKLLLENDHNPDVTSKSGFTPLHIASHYGNQSIANLLIQKGADVNYSAKHNITPLHVAAKWGKNNMVAVLLEQGAHIEAKTRDGLTPLHCAARSGHEQVVDMLLEKSAPISSKTKNGLAPLHMAAQGDHVDAARILLYHRAPVDEVTVDYLTALHVAAHCGHVRVAKLLLDRQADANARALNGFTPLHIACKKNRIKVVELLLKHGACIAATTESGLTPLHVASFMGCMNIVIYLLQHDASPDIPTVRGETPLHLAARANQTDIIRILLRNGAQVDARAREQQTPLHIASRLGNVDIVMLLLQHGAKVDNSTKDMYTALHIAAKEGQDEVAAVLIENGASLNATTKKGFTPLHLAAKYGHLKVAKLLLQKEAPVDAQGKNGVTPLHVASHYDHQNVALLLLDKGASPHANAKNGHTPLHIAARKNQMDIAHTLLEYGAQPDAESKAGFTPLHLSSQEGHTEISALLLEHKATPSHQSKNGLTPMHLCAQENKVGVAQILHNNGAEIDPATKGGYTPLHIASHYGQADMVKFLLSKGADVKGTTSIGYTPLHQAAQQGHTNIVNILLENSAQPNAVTNSGQTPLHIAQKLGYITVIDTLKEVTESTQAPSSSEEKYRVVAPEAMQETYLSDSEEEGEDTLLGDQTYRYLTADEMKSLGDDSLPIDVTRDERIDSNRMVGSDDLNAFPPRHIEDSISPEHIHPNYVEYIKKTSDNIDISKHPLNIGFLVSFLVDARGGAMRGCRHSGVRVIVPPRSAHSPTRITCRYVRPQRTPHPPPLMEGEALASRVLELGPVGATFLGPVIIEVPHFAALRGKEREIVVLRSDNGESWKEHTVEATEDVLNEILRDSFDADDLNQLEDVSSGRITRIVTQDFPQYFAVISRIRQEVHAIGPEGGMVSSTVVPQVQAVFPQGALTKKIKVGLQAQPIDPELTAKMLGHGVAVSPVVTVEPRRRKFHKAITLSMPAPRAHSQGMINQYSGSAPTLRLLCSITGGTSRAQWEDVTGSTPLTFVNDCVSFTTTVSARFWLMDCRNIGDATKMATELYREAIHVPFIAKFMVFAKRIDPLEARLRVFCMTDDKEDKTLEYQEQFTEIAKSRDVEVLEGKSQYIEFVGNLVPVTKSGEQLQFSFRAFKENRLPFSVRVKDQHAEAVSRCLFMREPKVQKGEPPQQPICILNILLPDDIVSDTISLTDSDSVRRKYFGSENFDYYRQDPRLADISNLLGDDWIQLANQLGLTSSEINVIKSEYPDSVAKQAQSMLRMWLSQSGNRTQANTLDNALRRIGRDDIVIQCLNEDNRSKQIMRIKPEEKEKYRLKDEISDQEFSKREDDYLENEKGSKTKSDTFDKYSAEEKSIEPSDEEDDFNKTVPEIREQIVKRLSHERTIPASSQRVEIVQEISSIKRKSLVEDKIAEVQQKTNNEPMKIITIKPASKISLEKKTLSEVTETKTTSPEYTSEKISESQEIEEKSRTNVSKLETQEDSGRRDSILLEEVTHRLEYKKPVTNLKADEDPKSPKFSKTPPPSPADFIMREKEATTTHEWCATKTDLIDESTIQYQGPNQEAQVSSTCRIASCPSVSYERVHSNPEFSISENNECLQNIKSYAQIDDMLDKMLNEVELINSSKDNCFNCLTLEPSTDALIEIPIKKQKKEKIFTSKVDIFVREDRKEVAECSASNDTKSKLNDSKENNEIPTIKMFDESLCSPYKCDILFGSDSNRTYDLESDFDIVEDYYEPIDFCTEYQVHDKDNIWWEGTYRNLSVVLEEDEENLSQTSSKPNVIYTNSHEIYDFDCAKYHAECRNELTDNLNEEYSDSSQLLSSISSDDSDNDFHSKDSKANIKLLVQSQVGEPNLVEIKSINELMTNRTNQSLPSTVHGNPRKLNKFANKLSNIWDKRKHNHYSSLQSLNRKENKKLKSKASFTLPRLFLKNAEAVSYGNMICNSKSSERKHNIFAKPTEFFPLSFDHANLSAEKQTVDLYANIPFYPTYDGLSLPISTSSPRKIQYIPSTDVTISEAYCNWSSEIEFLGQATSPQYLDKLEGKLLDKTVDTCVVELSNTEIREVYDFEQISNQTNAFLKFESEGEPYDVYTDLLHKDMKTENESPRNTTIEKKKVKKGIFKTLKTFITKSTENLVSESEKLSPKKEKIDRRMRTSSDVQVESSEHRKPAETVHKMDEEKQNKLSEEYKPKKTTNVKDMPTNIVASTYQADEIKNDSNKTIVKTMAESTEKNISQPPDTKDIETNILADNSKANRKKEEIYLVNDPTEIKKEILVYADEITKTEEKIDRTDQNKENNTRDLVTISNRSLNYNNKSEDSEITRKEIKLVPEDESEQTSKKTGIWSFLTKKPKKTTSENETNLSSEKHEDDSKVTRLFLQQEQNNYDDGLLHTKNESLENAPSILNKNLLQKKNSEKSGICESLLSKLKPSDSSLMDMEPSYVKFDEDDLAYNPVSIVPHENKKKVTFEEITHEEKLPTKEPNDEQLPPAERLICRMKDMNSDAQISNTLVLSEENNDERRFDEEVTVKGKEKHIIERKLEDDDLHDESIKLSSFTPDIITTQTSEFLKTEITLYDGEKRTTGSTQNMQDEKCSVTKIPESGIINENLDPSDRTLGERETSRIKSLDSGDILESKTNVDITAKSDIVEIDGLSTNDTNASKFSDADLIIMSDTFLKQETTQYDDMKTTKPEADSIVTENISKQQDDSKRKKFFNLFSKKKTVSDENVYSKETEHKREVKVEKVDPTSKQTELDIRGTTNVLNYSTKNRDEEVAVPLSEPNKHFIENAKTTTNYEIPAILTKTETANISNPISATCDFLITEKKFYDSMNYSTKSLSHVDLQVESFGNKTTIKNISDQNEIFQEKKNLKDKKQSEKNNEVISPHDEFLLVSDLPCEVDNESKLQSYSSKISIPHSQNYIQSTDNFLHIEKNSYDSDINRNQGCFPGYSNYQKDETKTKQISKHLTISSNSFDQSDAELIDVPKENIEKQESVEISETDIKQTSEFGKSNIVPEKSISKNEKLQYSSQELINSTFDFLRVEIMTYRDVKGPIVEEMSQETTVKENVENIEIDKQTYQSEKIPEKKSRRFLKIFGKKSKAKSEKNENKERAADIIATENFLKIEKTIYNNATSVSLEEKEPEIIETTTDELNAITLENQASLTRDKNTKTKGIFKIFSRKSEEKDKVKVESQTEIPKEIPVSENKSQMNKSSIISSENTNIFQTDILNTNSQDISKATDIFLNIEKKLYHDTECSVFNKSSMNEASDDKYIPGASNSLVEEKQHPEKPAKRRKFLKIFQRKSEERDLLKDSKVREPHSEEKTAGDELEEEKQVENRNRFNIFGKKSKPVEEKQAHHETRERTGDKIYNSRELIEMTNEFLQKEKTKYSDVLPTTPINYISDNSSIDQSLTAIIHCNKSGAKFNGYELHEHKPLDARVQLRNEKSCVAITLKGTETSKKCDSKFELREDSTEIPNVHIFSTDVNTREKDSNDIQSAGIKYSEIEKDEKIEKKFRSEDESMKQIAPKDLSSNIQTDIHDTYNIPITNKDEQIQSIKQNKSVENEIPIASDNRNTEQKKLKSKSLPTDILDKEGKAKSIFRIFSRRSRSRERKDQFTRIEQTKEENLSINNLKACKVFLEKEVELYPEPIPTMKSDYLKSTHSNISEAKGTDMSNLLNTSEESSKQRHISSCSEEKSQSEHDQTKINEKDESSNDTFDSAATIQKELQSFQTSFQSGEKEHGQTIRNIQNIDVSSKENGNVKGDKEYTAFDFIEEEVKNFENSRLPFTDTIDSSFRVENEVVHIGGDEPKETITKKIIISEKLIEKPGPANSNSETMNAILEKLMNETFTHEVDHQPIDKQCSALTSEEISNENNIDENLISHVSQSSDKIPLQTKSKSKEKLECIEVEYVHKMKDLELAKGDVIEDVSPLEKKIEIISNDHSEEITDLDEGLQNELINTKNATLVTETATELPILSTNVGEPMTISDAETYAEEGGCLVANSNNPVCEKKVAITKLTDKEIQQHDVPETVRVTENFIKEFEIQFHPDRSILSKDKDIATLSSNEMKDQVLDEITKWTSHNEFTNVHFSQDDNLFDDFVIDPSNQRTSNIVSSFELAEKIDPSSMFHSCTQQETGQEKNETARIDDAAQVESSIHENIRENKSSDSSTRRPLFRLESDEDDFIIPFTPKELENQEHNISEVVMDHPPSLEQDEAKLELENIVAVGPKSDVQIIEDKLRDLGKALDALEKLSEIKSDNKNEQLNEKKLRRVERKFERMASETLESTKNNEQEVKTFNSAEIDPYQQLVSHLSTDEVISSQNDYNSLWDEYTFSKSDEWDSKTPESQADVLELPQDTCKQLTEASQKSFTNIQTPQPKPRHQKSKDIIEEPTHESNVHIKQISPVRDDLLDEHDRAEEISYLDKKKFWENISKFPSQKQPEDVIAKKRKSIGETSIIPIPKPRGGLQFSYSLTVTDNEKSSLMGYTEAEDILPNRTDEMTLKEFLEHDSQISELSENIIHESEDEATSRYSLGRTGELLDELNIADESKSQEHHITSTKTTVLKDSEFLEKDQSDEIQEEPISEEIEKPESDTLRHSQFSNREKFDEIHEELNRAEPEPSSDNLSALLKSIEFSNENKSGEPHEEPNRAKEESKIAMLKHSEIDEIHEDPICVKIEKSESSMLEHSEVSEEDKPEETQKEHTPGESALLINSELTNMIKLDDIHEEPIRANIETSAITLPEHSELLNENKPDENYEGSIRAKVEKSESADSDTDGSGQNSSLGGDNAGYISDCGDVEHYISDSEIEDRVPQIRERQMSVFVAPSVSQRTRYERSASLPTEDLYEISARNIKFRKLYYEEQIKKEMIKEQLTIDLEDDISPERKSINSSSDPAESNEQKNTEQNDTNNISNEDKIPAEYIDEASSATETKKKVNDLLENRTEEESEIHVDKSETEKSEKASDKVNEDSVDKILGSSDQLKTKLSPTSIGDDIEVDFITADQPKITVTLSGIQKRISEEDDPYTSKVDCKISDSTAQISENTVTSTEIKEEETETHDEALSHINKTNEKFEENSFSATNIQIGDELAMAKEASSTETIQTNYSSIVYPLEENTDNTIWEVSVESEVLKEEKLSSLPSIPLAIQRSSPEGKFGFPSDNIVEKEEDLSSELRDESDLGSEIHQDHSDSYASDKIQSESHSDMKKIILDSLHQQKVDPNEAKMIANSLIAEIESEIQKVERFSDEIGRSESSDSENQYVNNYLKELADAKGLDQREVELVESILERRQKQISKLTRGDTQASSMEITDEDLRYSEGDMDYKHVLEQQINQLKAEYSDNLKTDYDTLVEDQNKIGTKVETQSDDMLDDNQIVKRDSGTLQENELSKIESSSNENTYSHLKNVILEEDENISETITEDITKTQMSSQKIVNEKIDITKSDSGSGSYKTTVVYRDVEYGNMAISNIEGKAVSEEIEDISGKLAHFTKSLDSTESKEESFRTLNKDTKFIEASHSEEEILNSIPTRDSDENGMNISKLVQEEHSQSNMITSSDPEYELKHEGISSQTEHPEHDTLSDNKIKRTSSSDSKSSAGSAKSPDFHSVSSSDKKIDSESFQDVVFRQSRSEKESTLSIRNKISGYEHESYSSSGESHYHSFEIDGKSRPCSSDVEGILPTGSSEYESALNSQELSARSQLTSGEYHTAISSLSSKDSMRSFESESSGNLASIEISEASETLVPTNSDLEGDVDIMVDQRILDECELLWPTNTEVIEANSEQERSSTEYLDNTLKDSELDSDQLVEIPSKMKRSYEMTFQPEPKIFTDDSPHTESNDIEEKFGTSLDDGSILSVSLSSTSSAQLKTVIELSRNETSGPEESLTSLALTDQMSIEEFDSISKSVETNSQTHSTFSTVPAAHEETKSMSIDITNSTENSQIDSQKYNHDELKKKGHRRHESTSFIPALIHDITKSSKTQSLVEETEIKEGSSQNRNDTDSSTHSAEEIKEQNTDLQIKREIAERRDSHGKSSTTSSEKSSFEEAEAEAAFSMVAHISPVHKIKQICPIIEDIDAEKSELEAKERLEREREYRNTQIKDASPGFIPDIKVTEHMAPLDESNFRYPELEMERKELEQETQKTVELDISEANSSKKLEETDQGQGKVLEERNSISKENGFCEKNIDSESKNETSATVEKTTIEDERTADSPNSDSFELIEKPDIIDDFVVIEEVGKEASEMDSEGKSVNIQTKPKRAKKHDDDIHAYLAKSDPTPLTKMTELKYFPDNSNDELEFDFEESPPQRNFGAEKSRDYGLEYDKELEANRKWIEQQFHGDQAAMAAAGYGYEMEFERGPLEDIKEEDINDIDLASSRIGSLGSQKESGGSLTSVKDSYSSTPDYDVLAGRKYFTKSGEHDDISMSSLQEFENLERAMSLETKKFHHGSGSQDSSSNGSFKTRYYANKAQGDDISVSSLKEFEGLEKACIAVYKTEIKVKEEEELLSQRDDNLENNLISANEKQEEKVTVVSEKKAVESEADYEKRIFEINEIIRQAQNNVERFIDLKETDKTESLGRGDSIEEVSKVPDLDLDAPITRSKSPKDEGDPMITSTDSLDLNQQRPVHYDSTDSLDQKNNDGDIMTASTDSIELNNQVSKGHLTTDSIEKKNETSQMVCSDSLEIAVAATTRQQEDSLEEDEPKVCYDYSSSDTGKDFSSSVKEDAGEHDNMHELMLGSTDSLEPTSSAATHATYQYESDSVFSGSFTSGGSNTMVSSTDTIDPTFTTENVDILAAASKVWFDDEKNTSEKKVTFEHFGEPSRPYVSEVIEPSNDPSFSHTIHRVVEYPPEVKKVIFHGKDADENLQRFIHDFNEGKEVEETETIDAAGNIHVKRVVQKRYIIKPDDLESSSFTKTSQKAPTELVSDYEGKKTTGMAFSQLTSLTKSLTGDGPTQSSGTTEISTIRAQASRRRPLRYDISIEDQTEVDPREHDWRFDLYKYEQSHDSSRENQGGQVRPQTYDQQQLSEEMKELLEEMEKTNKK